MSDPKIPKCPACGNEKEVYIVRQTTIAAEDSTKPKNPQPPGAGVTHPAFELVQLRMTTVICRKCGNWFVDPTSFV